MKKTEHQKGDLVKIKGRLNHVILGTKDWEFNDPQTFESTAVFLGYEEITYTDKTLHRYAKILYEERVILIQEEFLTGCVDEKR